MSSSSPTRCVAYVRMSTEHQQYSTENQMDIIREYAKRRNMEIVHTYSDGGKSGLSIQGRDALGQLIRDVEGKQTTFSAILVYDVSRWGRFQDADESAYYEFICKRVGILVHYCAEQFENDGSPVSTIVKGVKRAMAGEYSRELSSKVFQGACRLIQLGYKQGGTAGYGLRRMLIDQAGAHKGMLKLGEQKSIQTDRVILVPGPKEEVETVRWMYHAFVHERKVESEITATLNQKGILTDFGRAWTRGTVHEVLTNEKYIGNNIYHRTSFKLKKKHVINPPEKWIRNEKAFEGIIAPDAFFLARGIILARSHRLSDEEMLEKLRGLFTRHGRVSGIIIDESEGMPSSAAFRHRFGTLIRAYQLIGYTPAINYSFIEINRKLREMFPEVVKTVIEGLQRMGAAVTRDEKTDLLDLNGEISTSLVLCRCNFTPAGSSRWIIRFDNALNPDITIAVRMDEANAAIKDYYLLPAIDMSYEQVRLAEDNGVYLDTYRFDSLEFFFNMAERCRIQEAA